MFLTESCPPFLTSAWLFTQPNFPTSPETIQVRVSQGQTPTFSRCYLAPQFLWSGIHSPSRCILLLCVSHFVSIPPSDFQHPGPSWCWAALPALVGEGAGDLIPAAGTGPWAPGSLVPAQIPGTLLSQCNVLTVCFSMSSGIFGFQTSYNLGFRWLFTLSFIRLARCSSWAQGELGSTPTYLATIFSCPFYYI